MKRFSVCLLIPLCFVFLSGCIFSTHKIDTGETLNPLKPRQYSEESVFNSVPNLTIACCEQSAKALKGTTTWTYSLENGQKQSFCSDSMHPLQATDHMEPLSLMPSTMSRFEPLQATLLFDKASPDEVSVRCWDKSCVDKINSPATEIQVQAIEIDFVDGTNKTDYTFTLLDGNYIYEIIATWNTHDKFEGVVHYSFYTTKWDITTIPIDNNKKI